MQILSSPLPAPPQPWAPSLSLPALLGVPGSLLSVPSSPVFLNSPGFPSFIQVTQIGVHPQRETPRGPASLQSGTSSLLPSQAALEATGHTAGFRARWRDPTPAVGPAGGSIQTPCRGKKLMEAGRALCLLHTGSRPSASPHGFYSPTKPLARWPPYPHAGHQWPPNGRICDPSSPWGSGSFEAFPCSFSSQVFAPLISFSFHLFSFRGREGRQYISAAHTGLELMTLPPQPSTCQAYRCGRPRWFLCPGFGSCASETAPWRLCGAPPHSCGPPEAPGPSPAAQAPGLLPGLLTSSHPSASSEEVG